MSLLDSVNVRPARILNASAVFPKMDEGKLMILVQKNECLYNIAHRDYSNNVKKDKVWADIRNQLEETGNCCIYFQHSCFKYKCRKFLQKKKYMFP